MYCTYSHILAHMTSFPCSPYQWDKKPLVCWKQLLHFVERIPPEISIMHTVCSVWDSVTWTSREPLKHNALLNIEGKVKTFGNVKRLNVRQLIMNTGSVKNNKTKQNHSSVTVVIAAVLSHGRARAGFILSFVCSCQEMNATWRPHVLIANALMMLWSSTSSLLTFSQSSLQSFYW